MSRVSRYLVLPSEEPTVATVSDPDLLKNQLFFAGAKKGYKVLIFANAGRVILYDPMQDKIVNMADVNFNKEKYPAIETSPSPASSSPR